MQLYGWRETPHEAGTEEPEEYRGLTIHVLLRKTSFAI